jgi:hypothetical protein
MDYKKLNDDEIIELCKEKGIEYYNSKTKKNFAKSTLISRLNKITPEIEVEPKEEIKEEEPVIEYKNEVIWTLSDEDKKNNDDYKEIESKLLNCIKSCHDYLYSNGSIVGLKASNDIIKIIILRLFNEYNSILTNLSQITNENTSPSSVVEKNNIKFTIIEQNLHEYSGYYCSICLFDYNEQQEEQQEVIKINCNHIFHLTCLSKWVNQNKQTCPICRNVMN